MTDQIKSAFETAMMAIVVAGFTAISGVAIALINAIKDKVLKGIEERDEERRRKKLDKAYESLEKITNMVVMSIEQEEKQQIISMMEDNKIDSTELYKLRAIAIDRILKTLSKRDKELLEQQHEDLNAYTADLVSSCVLMLKYSMEVKNKSKEIHHDKPTKNKSKQLRDGERPADSSNESDAN